MNSLVNTSFQLLEPGCVLIIKVFVVKNNYTPGEKPPWLILRKQTLITATLRLCQLQLYSCPDWCRWSSTFRTERSRNTWSIISSVCKKYLLTLHLEVVPLNIPDNLTTGPFGRCSGLGGGRDNVSVMWFEWNGASPRWRTLTQIQQEVSEEEAKSVWLFYKQAWKHSLRRTSVNWEEKIIQ